MDSKETVWLVMFVSVLVLDIALVLLTGVLFTIYFVVKYAHKLQTCIYGKVQGTDDYKADRTTNKVEQVPGIKIFRFQASIYFANAEHFREKLYKKTGLHPKKLKKKKMRAMYETLMRRKQELELSEFKRKRESEKKTRGIKKGSAKELVVVDKENERENKLALYRFTQAWQPPIQTVIIDVTFVNHIDSVGVKYLIQIVTDYKEVGIKVFLVGRKHLTDILRVANLHRIVDYNILNNSVHQAIGIAQDINQKEKMTSLTDIQLMKEVSEKTEREEEMIIKEEYQEYGMSLEDALETMETETGVLNMDDNTTNDAVHLLQETENMSDPSKGKDIRFDSNVFEMIGSHSPSQRDSYVVTAF